MTSKIHLGDIVVEVVQKNIKNLHHYCPANFECISVTN
jgi:hypothetical protein